MKKIFVLIALLYTSTCLNAQIKSLHVADTFHIKSSGGWDYIFADSASNKLFDAESAKI